jgi:hypothetical protein
MGKQQLNKFISHWGVVVVVIVWLLDLQVLSITFKVVSSNPAHGEVYSIQLYVIKFVSHLWKFSSGTPVSSINKTDRHDTTEILLKVALNTITLIRTLRANEFLQYCCLINYSQNMIQTFIFYLVRHVNYSRVLLKYSRSIKFTNNLKQKVLYRFLLWKRYRIIIKLKSKFIKQQYWRNSLALSVRIRVMVFNATYKTFCFKLFVNFIDREYLSKTRE